MIKIPNYYNFLVESEDSNKIFFCLNNNNISTVTSDNALPLNKLLDNFILNNFFEDVIVIQDLDFSEIKNLDFPPNSVVYSFKPKGIYQDVNTDERKKVHAFYDSLHNNDSIIAYMNENTVSSKVKTQKMFADKKYFPKAVFKKEDISKIGFPVVGKPDNGHSGEGIEKFSSEKELNDFFKKNPSAQLDIFCEFVHFEREYRAVFLEDKLFYLGERVPKIEKNVSINNKSASTKMAFVYAAQDIKKFPYLKELLAINDDVYKKLKMGICAIDIFLTKKDEIKVIEINSQCGLDPMRLLNLYEALYNKHFGELPTTKKQLKKELIDIFLHNEYENFSAEIKKSLNSVDYKNVKISKDLLKEVNKMDDEKINIK